MSEYIQKIYVGGTLSQTIDTRTLTGEKTRRIDALKAAYSEAINANYPQYKQNNAALGLLPASEAEELKLGISSMRGEYENKKSAINNAANLAELDGIYDTNFLDFVPLAQAKSSKINEIDVLLKSKQANSFFSYLGNNFRFHPDAVSKATGLQTLINAGVLGGANFPANFSWTDASGDEVAMNEAQFTGFGASMGAYQMQLDVAAKTKIYEVSQLSTIAAVEAYDVNGGW